MKKGIAIFIILGFFCAGSIKAQEPNIYCLALKQRFFAWGDCGDDPYFRSANTTIIGSTYNLEKEKVVPIPINFTKTGNNEKVELVSQGITISTIQVSTLAGGILNDHNLTYDILMQNTGVNEKPADASDPCRNNFNTGGKREGYTMTTIVYIDDPINLKDKSTVSTFCVDGGVATIGVEPFFNNYIVGSSGYESPVLQVALDQQDAMWDTIKGIEIRPNSTLNLDYPTIAGKKEDPKSNYFKWMGKRLKFRVVKTLLNGQKTYGAVAAGFVFYPKGPEFEIIQTKRTFCDTTVIITIKLKEGNDEGYFKLDEFKWIVKESNNSGFYNCTMSPKIGEENTYNIEITVPGTGEKKDPFKEDIQAPVEWLMQLHGLPDAYAVIKPFVIPPKPKLSDITVTQTNENSIPVNFDIPNKNEPYVMLSVVDNYSLAQQRRPYKIFSGNDLLMEIQSLPPDYNSDIAKYDAEFNTYFDNLVKNTNDYKDYFGYRYKQWFYQQSPTQIDHPSGAYRFYPYKYHTHEHTHTCTHAHEHIHWCYTTIHGETCLDNIHNLTNPDPHNLCDNSHTHTPRNDMDDSYLDNTSHTHSASHSHAHVNAGIHNHGETNEFTYYTYIGKKYSDGSTLEPLDKGTPNVSSISLSTVGFDAKYVFNPGNVEVNIWSKAEIESVINNLEGIALGWYDDYKAICKAKWIMEKFSIRVSNGIQLNSTPEQQLYLIDGDGCSYPSFSIKVRAPEPQFVIENSSPPKNTCAENGSATIRYVHGGNPPYEYGVHNKLMNPGDTIIVNNLSYGNNTIKFANGFTYPVPISKAGTGITGVSTTPNTCPTINGTATITTGAMPGLKTFTLTGIDFPNKVFENSTTSDNCTISGLPNGRYNLMVSSPGCSRPQDNVVVGNLEGNLIKENIFNYVIVPTGATTFDGSGGVSISFQNMVNNVDWVSGKPIAFRDTETSNSVDYTGVEPMTYNITARHKDNKDKSCDISKVFTITRPQFEAKVNLDEDVDGLKALVLLSSTNISATSYSIELLSSDGKSVMGEVGKPLSCLVKVKDTYYINLLYNNTTTKIYEFTYPFPAISYVPTIVKPSCPNSTGSITLEPKGGFGGSNYKVSTGNGVFTNTFNYPVSGGQFSFYLSDYSLLTRDVVGNPVEITRKIEKYFSVNIPSPERVSALKIDPIDVLCANDGNGGVSIEKFRGGSGKYSYRINDGEWHDTLTKVNNLTPGVYNLYIKDSQNGCPDVLARTFTISQPLPLLIDRQVITQPTCELENGTITVEVKGGNGAYKYKWLLGTTDFSEVGFCATDTCYVKDTISTLGNNLRHGRYSLTVEDVNGCKIDTSIILREYKNPSILNILSTDVRCNGESNGEVKVLSVGGLNSTSKVYLTGLTNAYSDSITNITNSFDRLSAGSYSISSIDVNGCRSNSSYPVLIKQPKSLGLIRGQIIPVKYKGIPTGIIQATVDGGNDGLKEIKLINSLGVCINSSYQRNDFPFFIDSLHADRYGIIATDYKGCFINLDNIEVAEPQLPLQLRVVKKNNALCKARTGSVEVEAEGGWGEYKFKRDAGNAFYPVSKFENLYAGSYTITVMDKFGATFSEKVEVSEPTDHLSSLVSGYLFPTCANNGEINLNINGGTAPYQVYNKTSKVECPAPLGQNLTISGLAAGNYTMRVTDNNGCLFDLETQLPKSQMLEVSFADPEYPTSKKSSDGVIHAVAKGGIGPLEYKWNKRFGSAYAETSASLKDVPSGHYELTVTEKGKCSVTKSYYLPSIGDYPFKIAKIEDETSLGEGDGYCKLTSQFNTWKEFDFITPSNAMLHINSGDSNSQFSCVGDTIFLKNLEGGTYFVSGLSADTNRVYVEFTIKPYTPFVVKSVDVENVERIGDSNGGIAVSVEGGAGDNTFEWSQVSGSPSGILSSQNSPEGSLLSGIKAGRYKVMVTDRFRNAISDTFEVKEPNAPLSVVAVHNNISCKTYNNGYVTLNAIGGWGDYQFKDDISIDYSNDNSYVGLDPRSHKFYIIDNQGVVDSVSVEITEPDYLTSTIAFIDSVKCNGANDGHVDFLIEGGTAPYRLANMNNPAFWYKGNTARGLAKGDYVFTFTDTLNCPVQEAVPVTIHEPESLLFSKIDVTHTTCNTDNGKISIDLKGGTKPYRYQWLDATEQIIGTTNSLSSLTQNGFYRLNVLDRNDCPQYFEQRINRSVNPFITNIDTTPVHCYGGSNGTAMVKTVKPGEPFAPYSFKWANGDTLDISNGYNKGIYSVTVTDTNKCSTVSYFDITQPDSLRISITDRKNAQCFGYNNAFLLAQGFGGVGNYTYSWSTGATTPRIENLYKGDYQLSIKDANQCETVDTFTIIEPDMLEVDLGDDIKMCPGNSRVIDGQDFDQHEWSTSFGPISGERYLTVREARDYFLKVTDGVGCFAWDTINLTIGNDALKADFLMASQAELGDTISIFELSNMVVDSVNWYYNKNAFAEVENKTGLDYMLFLKSQEKGIYNIELSAFSGGCTSTSTKQIEIIADSGGDPNDDDLGYKDPLIKSFGVNPNPNDGNFYAEVKLREVSNINLVLFSVASGLKMDERSENQLSEYSVGYNLTNLNSGVYLLILKAGNERKQVKIIIQ